MEKLYMCCAFILAVAGVAGLPVFSDMPASLLIERRFHQSEVADDVARDWWALVGTDTGFELRQVTLSVEVIDDSDPIYPSGKRVTIAGSAASGHSVFLVRALEALRAGPVRTVFEGVMRMTPGYPIRLGGPDESVSGQSYVSTTLFASGTMRDPESCCASDDYRLEISMFTHGADGSLEHKEQALLSVTDGTWPEIADAKLPEVRWIGDLDRDGVLDYLIDTSPKYSAAQLTLYLSSAAKKGQIVAPVAVLPIMGC